MIKKSNIYISVICFFLMISCNKEDSPQNETFDVVKYHQFYTENLILPYISNLVTNTAILNQATEIFTTTPNEANLTSLRNAWKEVAISFSKVQIGNLGDIQTSAVYLSIYSWDANESKIEEFLATSTPISESEIISLSAKARGLAAIEYLIFENDAARTISLFSNQRRKDFLFSLGKNIVSKINSLDNQWKEYSTNFNNNTSTGINGSINFIVNQMNFLLENVRRFKVGEPAGIENSSTIDVSLLQADKSEISLEMIKENIASIKTAYYGNTEGLDDYVSSISKNEDVNEAIANTFSAIENNIASLSNSSLKNAITANNSQVTELHENIKDLIILIKVDVASILSITVTFTDNDGDS